MRRILGFVTVGLCIFAAFGCNSNMAVEAGGVAGVAPPGSGDFGATQGGVQDMSFARELVKQGRVPPADAISVEAMFSEHDLPLQGSPCTTTLCLRGAMGVAPNAAEHNAAWVQIGMSSTIDPANFERPSLAVIATVDVSGSMGYNYGSNSILEPALARFAQDATVSGDAALLAEAEFWPQLLVLMKGSATQGDFYPDDY